MFAINIVNSIVFGYLVNAKERLHASRCAPRITVTHELASKLSARILIDAIDHFMSQLPSLVIVLPCTLEYPDSAFYE